MSSVEHETERKNKSVTKQKQKSLACYTPNTYNKGRERKPKKARRTRLANIITYICEIVKAKINLYRENHGERRKP